MTTRVVALSALGGVLALAGFNRWMASKRGMLPPALNAAERRIATPDGEVCVYERGQGEPVLLLHSFNAAASAFELRPLFDRLAVQRRVIAVDWLGFGRSDRPDLAYDAALYRRQLNHLLDALLPEPGDVVALSLPSQYVVAEAAARPGRFRRLVLISPTGFGRFGGEPSARGRLLHGLLSLPLIGEAFFNALTTRPVIAAYLRRSFAHAAKLPPELVVYDWQTARQPGAQHAPLRFVAGLLRERNATDAYMALRTPALLLFGEQPGFSDPEAARELVSRNPALRRMTLKDCGDLPHWEAPDETAGLVAGFLAGEAVALMHDGAGPAMEHQTELAQH